LIIQNDKDMTFTEINTVSKFKNQANNEVIIVKKFKKAGTKRVFFTPENEQGQRLTSTMFAKMYDAEALAKRYLKR